MSRTGGPVDRVEVFDVEIESVDLEQTAAGDAQPVEASHVAVAEDADLGPVGVVARSAGSEVQVGGVSEAEAEDDLQVGEVFKSLGGVGGEAVGVQADDGPGAAPVVVGGLDSAAYDVAESLDLEYLAL